MERIKIDNQILEILEISVTSKVASNAVVYTVKKPKGNKIGKLFIRENGFKHSYLFGQENVHFDTFEIVA